MKLPGPLSGTQAYGGPIIRKSGKEILLLFHWSSNTSNIKCIAVDPKNDSRGKVLWDTHEMGRTVCIYRTYGVTAKSGHPIWRFKNDHLQSNRISEHHKMPQIPRRLYKHHVRRPMPANRQIVNI